MCDIQFRKTRGTCRRWAGRQKKAVCKTGVANPEASHHNLVLVEEATGRPPWECHISHIFTLYVVPALLPFSCDGSMEKGLKV
jgi:hypothetical protein